MTVLVERRGLVGVITLNRPEKRNALDNATIDAFGRALDELERDAGIKAIVLTGSGDKAFCAGRDLTTVGGPVRTGEAGNSKFMDFIHSGSAKPVIAAVNGAAVAGGFELMLACDLAVSAEHARFGIPEVRRGLVAGAGGTLLPLRIPMPIALELGLTGDLVSAQRVYELGLVNRVVPTGGALDTALHLAETIAQNSPTAVAATRRLMYDTLEVPRSVAWERIREELAPILSGPDAIEGARAFLEKRPPKWQ